MGKKVTQEQFELKIEELEERIGALEDMLNAPLIYSSSLYKNLSERTAAVWAKFNRLYEYLGVEEVTTLSKTKLYKRSARNITRARQPNKLSEGDGK